MIVTKEYIESNWSQPRQNKIYCPSCGGNDAWVKDGVYCFNCGEYFYIEGMKTREKTVFTDAEIAQIRQFYSLCGEYYYSQIDRPQIDYLVSRGIDHSSINEYKIGFCPPTKINLYNQPEAKLAGLVDREGKPFLSDRIIFPYHKFDNNGESIYDLRGRAFTENTTPRYKSPYNSAYTRGADIFFNFDRAAQASRDYMILTEGEIGAIVAQQMGFPTIALPGINSWRRGSVLDPSWNVIIIYDNVVGGSKHVDTAIEKAARRIMKPFVVTLPLLGENSIDLDSFLLHRKGGEKRLRSYCENAIPFNKWKKYKSF